MPILATTVDGHRGEPRDEKLVAACLALLQHQLELIRYRSERGHKWAIGLLDDTRRR